MPLAELLQWILRGALAVTFVSMGISHFVPATGRTMAAMIPPALKSRISGKVLVWFTGLCEIAGGIGLLVPFTQFAAGMALIVFLCAVFPANAVAAANRDRFGRAAIPFWPRYVAQLVLVALVALASV